MHKHSFESCVSTFEFLRKVCSNNSEVKIEKVCKRVEDENESRKNGFIRSR
jgi:hypothetical protein